MIKPLYIDASMLKDFECREFGRQRYFINRDLLAPNIHYQYGIAIHRAIESFWQGKPFEQAMQDAYDITNAYPVGLIKHNVYASNRWMEMVEQLPDLIAAYYDVVKQDVSKVLRLEHEWVIPYPRSQAYDSAETYLCGRIDRLMEGPELPDIKTASEISSQGIPWKQGYQKGKTLEIQFGLYDWYLQQIGLTPKRVYLDVLIKGYRGKPCRYELIELPYIITDAYRERFKQQLDWKVTEIVDYMRNRQQQKPWPMSQQLCQTKFSECPFLDICYSGETPKVLEKYTERSEHLEVRK